MKPFRPLRLLALLPAFLILGGCVYSKYPLGTAQDARPDARLVGQWHDKKNDAKGDAEDTRVSFDAQGKGQLSARREDGTWGPAPRVAAFFVTRSKTTSYFNVRSRDDTKEGDEAARNQAYLICKYEVSADGRTLTYWPFDSDVLAKAVEEGRIKGEVQKASVDPKNTPTVILRDSSEDLLRFVESSPEALFGDPTTLTRVE